MAYETGVSTSEENLLAKIATFAAARGWTVNTGGTGGDGPSGQCSFNSDDIWVHVIAVGASDRLEFQPSTAYINSSTAYRAHTGTPDSSGSVNTFGRVEAIPGPHTAYYLFGNNSSPRYIHCVVEVSSGVYSHFHFGTVEKFGTYTGGGYCTSLIWSGAVSTSRPPFASAGAAGGPAMTSVHAQWFRTDGVLGAGSPDWTREFGPVQNVSSMGNYRNPEKQLWLGGLMPITQRTILAPIFLRKNLTVSTPGRNVTLGRVQDVRMVSMEFHSGGDEIVIGSDTWKIFPPRAKDTGALGGAMTLFTTTSSGYHGLAFRKFS